MDVEKIFPQQSCCEKKTECLNTFQTLKEINLQLRSVIEALEASASTDRLTQAWNRRRFDEVIESEIHRSNRYGHPISLMFIDIDNFKLVNDLYGHLEGDAVLVRVAECIRTIIRKSDSLTRWGGEEFVVLLPNTGLTHAKALAERVLTGISTYEFRMVGRVTVSIGVAEFIPGTTSSAWIDRADRATYKAKHDGKNRVVADQARANTIHSEHVEGAFVKLVWKESFCSGNTLIDQQHRDLFLVANELLDVVLSSHPAEEVSLIVGRLLADVAQHFRDEEIILTDLSFEHLEEHRLEHKRLLDRSQELVYDFNAGKLSIGSLFQFLAYDVITRHMLGADREYFSLTQQ